MNVSHHIENINLSAGEIAELFNAYQNNSASIPLLSYFVAKAEDPEIKSVIEMSLEISKNSIKQISDIFKGIGHPVPKGFSMQDVNLHAPRLYSDKFMLTFVRFMARFGLLNYSEARACLARQDVRDFINQLIEDMIKLFNLADDLMLGKGLYMKEPYLPIPDRIDMIEKQSFLNGFFGDKRPINASEVNRLYLAFHRNAVGKAFLIGACQAAKDKEIKDYLYRGIKISDNHMETLSTFLRVESLPIPYSLDYEVTDSIEPVFSERLMIFFVAGLDSLGLGLTGVSFSRVMRRDLSLAFARIMSEIALYGEDGFNILIDKGWLERMPEAADRKELLDL